MKKITILSLSIFLLSSAVFALPATEDLMKIGAGSRPMGMGKAFVAVADDGNSVFMNPAGLAGLPGWQATSMYTSLFGNELPYILFSGSTPFKSGNLGFGVISTGSGQIPSPSATGISYFDYYDNLYFVSYAMDASRLFDEKKVFIGSNFKIFNKGFLGSTVNSGTGFDMDFGLKYTLSDSLSFGLNAQNVLPTKISWSSGAQDDIPMTVKAGTAAKVYKGNIILALDADFSPGRNLPSPVHIGAEWSLNKYVRLRAGLDQMISAASTLSNNPTAGIGLNLSGFKIDYAYHPFTDNPESPAHFISISYQSEEKAAKKPASQVTLSEEAQPVKITSKEVKTANIVSAEAVLPKPHSVEAIQKIVEAVPLPVVDTGNPAYKVRILNIANLFEARKIEQKLQAIWLSPILYYEEGVGYSMQVGVFSNKVNATKLLNKLRSYGYDSYMATETSVSQMPSVKRKTVPPVIFSIEAFPAEAACQKFTSGEAGELYYVVRISNVGGRLSAEKMQQKLRLIGLDPVLYHRDGVGYSLQVGAFGKKENAAKLMDNLESLGYYPYMITKPMAPAAE
ncbi:MAG: PorV/PorQ family protein [Candidatus Margulisiibacteriota bacterium]